MTSFITRVYLCCGLRDAHVESLKCLHQTSPLSANDCMRELELLRDKSLISDTFLTLSINNMFSGLILMICL